MCLCTQRCVANLWTRAAFWAAARANDCAAGTFVWPCEEKPPLFMFARDVCGNTDVFSVNFFNWIRATFLHAEPGSRLIFRFDVWKRTTLLLSPPCGSCAFAIRAKSKSHFVVFVLALAFYLHPHKRTRSEFCRVICRTTCPVVKFSAFVTAQEEGRFFCHWDLLQGFFVLTEEISLFHRIWIIFKPNNLISKRNTRRAFAVRI